MRTQNSAAKFSYWFWREASYLHSKPGLPSTPGGSHTRNSQQTWNPRGFESREASGQHPCCSLSSVCKDGRRILARLVHLSHCDGVYGEHGRRASQNGPELSSPLGIQSYLLKRYNTGPSLARPPVPTFEKRVQYLDPNRGPKSLNRWRVLHRALTAGPHTVRRFTHAARRGSRRS